METLAEGVSYDTGDHPGPPRDGVTLSARRDLRPLVLPAEVARLENLTGYLKFPGPWPVARIRLAYKERRAVAQRFVPREDGGSGSGAGSSGETDAVATMGAGGEPGIAEVGRSDRESGSPAGWYEEGWTPHEWALCDADDETGTAAGAPACASEEGADAGSGASSGGAGGTNANDGGDERHPEDWQ